MNFSKNQNPKMKIFFFTKLKTSVITITDQ